MLSEDSDRNVRLDDIEMQFYALSADDPFWAEHYGALPEKIRFSGAYRDVTGRIDNTLFALHGATAARFLSSRRWITNAGIHPWRIGGDDEVRRWHVEPSVVSVTTERGWEVRLAHTVLGRMHRIRERALPNETGGVLVGSYDTARRIAYICGLVSSPPDSEEWPALYIRGKAGLERAVEQLARASGNHLEYVGEWHTHPGLVDPSGDDETVLGWLAGLMGGGGLPGIMMIVGGKGRHRVLAESC